MGWSLGGGGGLLTTNSAESHILRQGHPTSTQSNHFNFKFRALSSSWDFLTPKGNFNYKFKTQSIQEFSPSPSSFTPFLVLILNSQQCGQLSGWIFGARVTYFNLCGPNPLQTSYPRWESPMVPTCLWLYLLHPSFFMCVRDAAILGKLLGLHSCALWSHLILSPRIIIF